MHLTNLGNKVSIYFSILHGPMWNVHCSSHEHSERLEHYGVYVGHSVQKQNLAKLR